MLAPVQAVVLQGQGAAVAKVRSHRTQALSHIGLASDPVVELLVKF